MNKRHPSTRMCKIEFQILDFWIPVAYFYRIYQAGLQNDNVFWLFEQGEQDPVLFGLISKSFYGQPKL